eukprot:jgi/Antlo1/2430/2569
MLKALRKERKEFLFQQTAEIFKKYDKFLVVQMDNVTSSQLQACKKAWRGKCEFVIRKNTAMRKALNDCFKDNPRYKDVMSAIEGNVAFILTNDDVGFLKKIIEENQRKASAKTGAIAQKDLWIEPMITSMDSEKAPYFQALGISYKITRSKLEIISRIKVLEEGVKVGPAQTNLLSLLDIHPFIYEMKIRLIYENGSYYEPWIIDVKREDIIEKCKKTIERVASLSLATEVLTKASVPYLLINCARNSIAIAVATNFKLRETEAFVK